MRPDDEFQRRKIAALVEARQAAERFLDAAYQAEEDLAGKDSAYPSKPYAAAKRASLDLTAALVRVRYPEGRS